MYLGHVIINDTLDKTITVLNFPTLRKFIKEIKSFLGLAGYYRRFISNFNFISQNLTKPLGKDFSLDCNTLISGNLSY